VSSFCILDGARASSFADSDSKTLYLMKPHSFVICVQPGLSRPPRPHKHALSHLFANDWSSLPRRTNARDDVIHFVCASIPRVAHAIHERDLENPNDVGSTSSDKPDATRRDAARDGRTEACERRGGVRARLTRRRWGRERDWCRDGER